MISTSCESLVIHQPYKINKETNKQMWSPDLLTSLVSAVTRFLFLSSCFSNSSTCFSFCLVLSHTSHGAPWQRVKSSSDWYCGLHFGSKSPVGRLCSRRLNGKHWKQVNGEVNYYSRSWQHCLCYAWISSYTSSVHNGPQWNYLSKVVPSPFLF